MVKPILLQTDGSTSRPITRSSLRTGNIRLANPTGVTRSRRPPTVRAPPRMPAARATEPSAGQMAVVPVTLPPPPPGPEPSAAPPRDPPQPAAGPADASVPPPLPCPFCLLKGVPGPSLHWPEHCPVVPLANSRKTLLKKAGQCFRCLYRKHNGSEEGCQVECYKCVALNYAASQHHPAIHQTKRARE